MTGDRRSPTRAHFHQMPRNPVLTERIEGNFALMYVEVQMVRMRTTRKPRKSKSADMFDSARVAATDRYRQHAEISCGNRGGRLWIGRGAFLSEQGGGEQVSVCGDHGYGNRGEAGGRLSVVGSRLSTATRACLCADCLEACDLEPTRPSRNAPVPSEHGHATIRGFQNARRRLTLTLKLRPPGLARASSNVPRATWIDSIDSIDWESRNAQYFINQVPKTW